MGGEGERKFLVALVFFSTFFKYYIIHGVLFKIAHFCFKVLFEKVKLKMYCCSYIAIICPYIFIARLNIRDLYRLTQF